MKPTASFWSDAHGAAADGGRLVASETKPSDELRPAMPADSVRRDHGPDGKFVPGNGAAKAKRIRSGPRGALVSLIAKGDPVYQAAAKWGRRYGSHRRSELAMAHGGTISAGVGAIVESAAEMLADARYWRAKGIAEGNADYTRLSAQLIAQARGCERDAWELGAREAGARRDANPGAAHATAAALFARKPAGGTHGS